MFEKFAIAKAYINAEISLSKDKLKYFFNKVSFT